jgi:hypothetical protein
MRIQMGLLLGAVLLTGCADLFGTPEEEGSSSRPRRSNDDDDDGNEGEGEGEGEGGEGEGEGELPIDTPPDPQGPRIISLDLSTTTLNDSQSASLVVVVTDPDGVDDIVGPVLSDAATGTTLGVLTSSGPGTFTATISWSLWTSTAPIEFVRGTVSKSIRVRFSDVAGHSVTQTRTLTMTCGGEPACDNVCGNVRCGDECSGAGGPVSDDDVCTFCGTGCSSCANGCACSPSAPATCTGAADCVSLTDDDANIATATCQRNDGPHLRTDGFIAWGIGGVDYGVTFADSTLANVVDEAMCAPYGGVDFVEGLQTPNDLVREQWVMDMVGNCTASTLNNCQPVLMPTAALNAEHFGMKVTCNEPIGEGEGEGEGEATFDCVTGGRTIDAEGTYNGSTLGGSSSFVPTCASDSTATEQVWLFTAPTSGQYTFESSGFDTVLSALQNCDVLSSLNCDDDGGVGSGASLLSLSLTGGEQVVLVVDGYQTTVGAYTLTITRQ